MNRTNRMRAKTLEKLDESKLEHSAQAYPKRNQTKQIIPIIKLS